MVVIGRGYAYSFCLVVKTGEIWIIDDEGLEGPTFDRPAAGWETVFGGIVESVKATVF